MTISDNLRQFIKFGAVGTLGAVVDFGSYGIMTRLLGWDGVYCVGLNASAYTTNIENISQCTSPQYPLVMANMVSVLLAIGSNFLLNKFWTFRDKNTTNIAAQGVGYLIMSIIAWILNQLLTSFFISHLAFLHALFGSTTDVAAKILAVGIILFFNYGGSKLVIFRQRGNLRPQGVP